MITPHDTSAAQSVLVVRRVAEVCGARLTTMAAQHHDEAVGQVSHVPQLMSALVAGGLLDLPAEHLTLAGQGLRDVTRIAGGDPKLWRQIISANHRALRIELQELHADLGRLIETIDDPDAVEAFLDRGRTGTRAIPGKHGSLPADWAEVVVEIPDAPGSLARLFADVACSPRDDVADRLAGARGRLRFARGERPRQLAPRPARQEPAAAHRRPRSRPSGSLRLTFLRGAGL